jgi:hypothetical protein
LANSSSDQRFRRHLLRTLTSNLFGTALDIATAWSQRFISTR